MAVLSSMAVSAAMLLSCFPGVASWENRLSQSLLENENTPTLTFSILEPGTKPSCTTKMHKQMFEALYSHPQYTPNEYIADLIFINVDTMLQIMWPYRAEIGKKEGGDFGSGVYARNYEGNCQWHMVVPTDIYEATLKNYTAQCTKCSKTQKFVYFRSPNHWDQPECEFDLPLVRNRFTNFSMIFVGEDLTDELSEGHDVNFLQPLLDEEKDEMPLPEYRAANSTRYKACFIGAQSSDIRRAMFDTLNDIDGFYVHETIKWAKDSSDYKETMRKCDFGFSPRGDAHYSFRTTELLNMGVIPVIIDDAQREPYNIPLREWALRLPEGKIHKAEHFLNKISESEKDRLRENGRQMLQMCSTPERTTYTVVQALFDSLGDSDILMKSFRLSE
eukprot:CAMPEP_0184478494 /NCGR_PEP_ID=MMETSP0113_2-20130426/504_1 /TAXON_ID=91329 /ORGANISM="Norrisiella sphaerica, Strain BC52" /LENGTH=388 /DNA_ID=CAMNT_0026856303 /DNA_START=37 /DNA_END=1203 /DNA_ORIENTATION=-